MSMTRILLMVREIRKQYQRQPSITKQPFSTNESSTDIGEAHDIHLRSVKAIACNKEQCRILYLDTSNKNLLTCPKRMLLSKFNTAKHTVEEAINSNMNLQLYKQKTICKDNVDAGEVLGHFVTYLNMDVYCNTLEGNCRDHQL